MSNITTILIVVLLIAYVLFHLNSGRSKHVEEKAYQWWYMPLFALLFVGLMYLIYNKTNFPEWPIIRRIFDEYKVEGVFFLLCAGIWTALEYFLLRSEDIHNKLIVWYRNLFADKRDDKERVLPFPYFIDEKGEVRSRVGQVFYRWTMKMFIILIAVVYIAFYILAAYAHIEFYLKSALALLALLPLVDYYVYLCANAKAESKDNDDDYERLYSDFDELWQLYVDTFDNYSVAWKRTLTKEELSCNKEIKNDNESRWKELMKDFSERKLDCIATDYDLVSAFTKLEEFFDLVEKNGQYVLIALDIPKHFSRNRTKAYFDEIADKLREIIRKDFYVYDGKSTEDQRNNSIILTPLALISNQGFHEEWINKIGLLTVINLFDKNISNMYDCRRFSYVLKSINPDCQFFFLTPYRRDVQPSIQNTWRTTPESKEKNMTPPPPSGDRQFFIGYNYEDYLARYNKVLISPPTEAVYSGSDLAPIALSSKIGQKEKVITPIHYLELAYSNAIEGQEELDKFWHLIDKTYKVSSEDIDNSILNHLLPFDRISEEQILNVVFDPDNNAPVAYNKWQHLGDNENFSIVVSKPYLFRDYFNANHTFFTTSPFAAIQPCLSKSRVTLAIVLLNMLQNARMEENELRNLLKYYYKESEITSVSTLIKDLFTTYFTTNLAQALFTEDLVEFNGEQYLHCIYYSLQLDGDHDQHYLDMVTIKDESGNELFDILKDLMEQNYVTEQIHSFSGRPFQIKDFNSSTNTLNVSRVNNEEKDVIFYRPSMTVSIKGKRHPIKEMNPEETLPTKWNHPITGEELFIKFEGFETGVSVKTNRWYAFNKYTTTDCTYSDSIAQPRNYSNGKVLKLSFKFIQKPNYLEHFDDIRKSLQILLYEVMQSIFPHHAQYLIISSIGEGDDDLPWIFNQLSCEDLPEKGVLSYYLVEDAHIDLGLIGALSDRKNILYILRYLYDYLIWLTEGDPVTPVGYEAYLNKKNFDKQAFLKYGREHLPAYFDIELLINFIRDIYQNGKELQETLIKRQNQHDFMGQCDFCAKEMKNSEMQRLEDGRMRCPDCSVDAIDTKEQFNAICEKAKDLFREHLSIDFSSIPHTGHLVSAVDLHKMHGDSFNITNRYDRRELLGFAHNTKPGEFFVENGYKPDDTLGTVVHEMTHIWQFEDDEFKKIRATNEDWVEGLAVWTDLFLTEKAGVADIENKRAAWLSMTNEYGRGLQLILDIMETSPFDTPYQFIHDQASRITT